MMEKPSAWILQDGVTPTTEGSPTIYLTHPLSFLLLNELFRPVRLAALDESIGLKVSSTAISASAASCSWSIGAKHDVILSIKP